MSRALLPRPPQSWNYGQHAVYLATVAAQFREGVANFSSVEPFNEPVGLRRGRRGRGGVGRGSLRKEERRVQGTTARV